VQKSEKKIYLKINKKKIKKNYWAEKLKKFSKEILNPVLSDEEIFTQGKEEIPELEGKSIPQR